MSARGPRGRNDAVCLARERARGGPGRSDGRAPGAPAGGRSRGAAARLARRPADQTAYQIRIATSPAKLGSDVWDSGKVASAESVNVAYAGPALPSATRLCWTVRTLTATATRRYAPPPPSAPRSRATGRPRRSGRRAPVLGTDYDVDVDFTVTTVAAGIKFRVNGSNGFMWQIRGDSSNELRPHVQVNGTYSQLKAVRLPMTIGLNTKHHARSTSSGSTIRTFIDGVLVDTTIDTRNPNGSIGFRHGNTESARFDNVKVTSTAGATLYTNDFDAAAHRLRRAARSPRRAVRRHRAATARTASPTTGRSCASEFARRRQADRLGHRVRLRALDRARPPVRLQALAQRQGRRRRPDARDQQRDADDVQRVRRHGAAARAARTTRSARSPTRRPTRSSSPSS